MRTLRVLRSHQVEVVKSCAFNAEALEQHRSKMSTRRATTRVAPHQRDAAQTLLTMHRQVDKGLTMLVRGMSHMFLLAGFFQA
ncbi:MAG: hypothetical protein DKT66_24400 [Candidatus Melainabacteria bacterium]|nr:MAG: hypothetical protein DKT66_24400 [Candidatus Melainabacteria bacterium]